MGKGLLLTLSKKPFEVMITGEKVVEYRKPSKWIESRLYMNGTLKEKHYKTIRFQNGDSKDSPYFIAEFKGFYRYPDMFDNGLACFSNGLEVVIEPGDYIIQLGNIIEKGNV